MRFCYTKKVKIVKDADIIAGIFLKIWEKAKKAVVSLNRLKTKNAKNWEIVRKNILLIKFFKNEANFEY